ncbi:hypothetical protein QNE78_004039 [Vibrio vulnificus]|nr:hypothetical protein [Vibrio vulnificus]
MMSLYYLIAVLLLAGSALFGYLGANYESNKSDEKQLSKISQKFDELGEQVQAMNSDVAESGKIKEINKQYKDLAEEYMNVLPQQAQRLVVEKENAKLNLLSQSHKYKDQLEFIRKTSSSLIQAFNDSGANISYSDMVVPSDMFGNEDFQLRISVQPEEYWSVHLVDRIPNRVGIMFVRIEVKNDYEYLTDDSIVFRWLGEDRYGFSLNGNISKEVSEQVSSPLSREPQTLDHASDELELLLQNIIKYSLAKSYSHTQA